MKNIELVISEGIKTGKWIDISYKNTKEEITYYWIAINDIDLKNKILNVYIFNDQKSLSTLEAKIKFDNIQSAKILEFTTYDVPNELIYKIEQNREEAKWLKYESFNNNILKYFLIIILLSYLTLIDNPNNFYYTMCHLYYLFHQ